MRACLPVVAALLTLAVATAATGQDVLPPAAAAKLARSRAAVRHSPHVWRDTPPSNADGTINAYVEISRGDRRKWEFDMARNARVIDRVLPRDVGGLPVNYGFVPQTVWYDGDPLDVLILGPALRGGQVVRAAIIGLMHMADQKGEDSKIVLSPLGRDGRPRWALDDAERQRIAAFFQRYKRGEPGGYSAVMGWGAAADAERLVTLAHRFFIGGD